MTETRSYSIQLENVREVCLLGQADLGYWEQRLELEGLYPTVRDSRAELLICTFRSRWKGVRFGEGIISVFTSQEKGGARRDGSFLVRAFNTRPFFAWIERTLYRAPYHRATISNGNDGARSYLELIEQGKPVIEARMGGAAAPTEAREQVWEGPAYLPKEMNPGKPLGKLFYVKLEGPITIYPFVPGQDTLSTGDSAAHAVSRELEQSHLVGVEWWIREAGRHSKSDSISR